MAGKLRKRHSTRHAILWDTVDCSSVDQEQDGNDSGYQTFSTKSRTHVTEVNEKCCEKDSSMPVHTLGFHQANGAHRHAN